MNNYPIDIINTISTQQDTNTTAVISNQLLEQLKELKPKTNETSPLTEEQKFAIRWCYAKAMDYVEEHSPTKNPYEHQTGPLDLIVNGINITQIMKELM